MDEKKATPLAWQRAQWAAANAWAAGDLTKATTILERLSVDEELPPDAKAEMQQWLATVKAQATPATDKAEKLMNRALPGLLMVLPAFSLRATSWWTGKEPEIKRAPGDRLDVVLAQSGLKAEEAAADVAIAVPEQTNLAAWPNHNTAMLTPHIGLTGLTHSQSVAVGEGNDFSRGTVASPVVSAGLVMAMDAGGYVSAHNEAEISQVKWVNRDGTTERVPDTLGGGLAVDEGAVFATTGYGNLRSIDVASGKTLWSIEVGAPVRGAPAIGEGW